MGLPGARPAGRPDQKLSGHFEMEDQACAILQGDDQVFAPPSELRHPKPPKPPQVGWPAALEHMRLQNTAGGEPPADQAAGQAPPNGLDFREFWHGDILSQFCISNHVTCGEG
jgi:hypothetical protein